MHHNQVIQSQNINKSESSWLMIDIHGFIFHSVANVTGLLAVGGLGVVDVEVDGRLYLLKPFFVNKPTSHHHHHHNQ